MLSFKDIETDVFFIIQNWMRFCNPIRKASVINQLSTLIILHHTWIWTCMHYRVDENSKTIILFDKNEKNIIGKSQFFNLKSLPVCHNFYYSHNLNLIPILFVITCNERKRIFRLLNAIKYTISRSSYIPMHEKQ